MCILHRFGHPSHHSMGRVVLCCGVRRSPRSAPIAIGSLLAGRCRSLERALHRRAPSALRDGRSFRARMCASTSPAFALWSGFVDARRCSPRPLSRRGGGGTLRSWLRVCSPSVVLWTLISSGAWVGELVPHADAQSLAPFHLASALQRYRAFAVDGASAWPFPPKHHLRSEGGFKHIIVPSMCLLCVRTNAGPLIFDACSCRYRSRLPFLYRLMPPLPCCLAWCAPTRSRGEH